MKRKVKAAKDLVSAIGSCIAMSWKSSKAYTVIRLVGKAARPVTGIISAYLVKLIIDVLSGSLAVSDKQETLLLLVGLTAAVSLISAAVQKAVSYAEGLHNNIIERYITLDMMDKALSADLSMFDNPVYYDKLTSVTNDSYATSYLLQNALDCASSAVTFIMSFAVLCTSNWLYGAAMVLADTERACTDEAALAALVESGGDSIINNLENGLDTYITRHFEENGVELSGGQNQKIALARTFYRDCSALVLDPEAEHRLFESLERLTKGKTTLFTSHRLSNITLADRIAVIENGDVVEIGTRDELLNNPNRFAELYQYQAENFK